MNHPKFVRALIKNNNKFLIMKSRYGNTDYWNFPGGKVEANETGEEAVVREVSEETNLLITNYTKLSSFNIEVQNKIWKAYIYIVNDYCNKLINNEPHKCVEMQFKSIEEVNKLSDVSFVTKEILNKYHGILHS